MDILKQIENIKNFNDLEKIIILNKDKKLNLIIIKKSLEKIYAQKMGESERSTILKLIFKIEEFTEIFK